MALAARQQDTASEDKHVFTNGAVQTLLTDLYQITMAYAYWKSSKKDDHAVFELYFRKNPFHGEFTIFAGLEDCLQYLKHFSFSSTDIEYLRTALPSYVDPEFYHYLAGVSGTFVKVYAVDEGNIVFPRVPLLRLEGPLPIVQLLETTMLNLVNYASLVSTNAARFRLATGSGIQLLEFGLRRAQGPDGGLSASRYCYMGGFDGTSNVLAGKLFGIPVQGTLAHSFVNSFSGPKEIKSKMLQACDGSTTIDVYERATIWLEKLAHLIGFATDETSDGELSAFVAFSIAFPTSFLALVDTYDVLRSGAPNFCAVALTLDDLGYKPVGIRLDSGDLSYLSLACREMFVKVADTFQVEVFKTMKIVASNDINEDTILSLNQQGHSINCFGIGTHLVTCQKQPALGCVFKLVEINGQPRIKLSEDISKVTIPGSKNAYRLYGQDGHALVDIMTRYDEAAPAMGQRVLSRHPFEESKRAYVSPSKVENLLKLYWDNGVLCQSLLPLSQLRKRTHDALHKLRPDHTRALNPTPYKVSVSDSLYQFMHRLWLESAPIGELA